jgi:hypothetical protein
MRRAREGRREEQPQGLFEEEGGFAVAVAAAPVVGNGQVEDHPLRRGGREGGRERGRMGVRDSAVRVGTGALVA